MNEQNVGWIKLRRDSRGGSAWHLVLHGGHKWRYTCEVNPPWRHISALDPPYSVKGAPTAVTAASMHRLACLASMPLIEFNKMGDVQQCQL